MLKTQSSDSAAGASSLLGRRYGGVVRSLVAQAGKTHATEFPATNLEPTESTLIFNGDVDGVRYLLLKKSHLLPEPILLSPREREIARMVAKGYPNKTIAAVLDISIWTVSTHLRRVYAKLRVTSRAAMVAQLMDDGLLQKLLFHPAGKEVSLRSKRTVDVHPA